MSTALSMNSSFAGIDGHTRAALETLVGLATHLR
jgi:hypothetical protein